MAMAMVIPQVQVPMNFGVQYLGSPAHSNLKFVLGNGEELLANSMIISYNSSVIENLTTTLFQSRIEVEDFSKCAVQCFLEASYSGDIEKISMSNFRDVNKMGHVFGVAWIVDRCYRYFESLTEAVKLNNYTDQLFVFEEAMFVLTQLKRRSFVDLVIKKFTSLASCTQNFVTNYLSDIPSCPTASLDVIIEMTGKEEHILIRVLVNHLKNKNCFIDANTRYILERLSFTPEHSTHKFLYRQLIDKMEGISNPSQEDFKLMVGILKRTSSTSFESSMVVSSIAPPNMFHNFQQLDDINDIDTLVTYLLESPNVMSSYMFYDAVFCWMFQKRLDSNTPVVTISDSLVDKLLDTMRSRCWAPLPREYIDTIKKRNAKFGGLTSQLMKNEQVITVHGYNRIVPISDYTWDELFFRSPDIKFKYKEDIISNCTEEGDCGFILRVTAASGKQDDSFNIQLVIDPNLCPDDVHFHEEWTPKLQNCHLVLDLTSTGGTHVKDMPVGWYGKPCRDGTNKYWWWGAYRFHDKGEGRRPVIDDFEWCLFLGPAAKIRPVVYLSS